MLDDPAACETVTVFVRPPEYVMVIVAFLAAPILVVALAVIVAFPVPEVVLTESHDALSVILQVQLEVITKVPDDAIEVRKIVVGLRLRNAAACDTAKILVRPPA